MPEGLHRFEVQLTKLEQILNALPASAGRALAFYQSPARQYLFYLEALTHIYRKIHNHKRFERMRLSFKLLEDQLGKIDYYDGFIKEFVLQPDFPPVLLDHLNQIKAKETTTLGELLVKEGWLNQENGSLHTIRTELKDVEWKTGFKETKVIGETIISEIERIKTDYHSGKLNFTTIENGVHEFRRQLRWISIYAQALDGLIQIKKVPVPDPILKDYMTKDVLNSPFNVMPPLREGIVPIYIQAPDFYALSWIIAEGGKLKDEALRIICIENAIRETNFVHEGQLKQTAKRLAFKSTRSPRQVKEAMKVIADKFIHHDKVLDRIMDDIRLSIGG